MCQNDIYSSLLKKKYDNTQEKEVAKNNKSVIENSNLNNEMITNTVSSSNTQEEREEDISEHGSKQCWFTPIYLKDYLLVI